MTDAVDGEVENLPAGTATVQVLHRRIACSVAPDREFDADIEETVTPGMRHNKAVAFPEGSELPLDIPDRCWPAFADRLAAYDADGNRLDQPSHFEEDNFSQAVHNIPRQAE